MDNVKEAIVIAGGFGTRLSSVVKNVPKPMADVAGKPFLSYIIDKLQKNGINKVVLAVGYLAEVIIDYFKENYHGVQIQYSIEKEPLGTGGAIKQALQMCTGPYVVVLNGDTYFDADVCGLYQTMIETKADIVLAVKPMKEFDRYGTLCISDQGRIIGFEEKKYVRQGYINGGMYMLPKNLLTDIAEKKFSFETDYLEKYVILHKMQAFYSDSYFIDIGIPEDYAKAQKDFDHEQGLIFGSGRNN